MGERPEHRNALVGLARTAATVSAVLVFCERVRLTRSVLYRWSECGASTDCSQYRLRYARRVIAYDSGLPPGAWALDSA